MLIQLPSQGTANWGLSQARGDVLLIFSGIYFWKNQKGKFSESETLQFGRKILSKKSFSTC